MNVLATPLDCESGNDLTDASGCRARWAERFQRANEWAEQDAVFTLEAVVTRARPARQPRPCSARRGMPPAIDQVQLIEALLEVGVAVAARSADALAGCRSRRTTCSGWSSTTTVRATKQPPPLDVPLPREEARRVAHRTRPARAWRRHDPDSPAEAGP